MTIVEVDEEGFLKFPVDDMTAEEFIEYRKSRIIEEFESTFGIKLADDQRVAIFDRFGVSLDYVVARKQLLEIMRKTLEGYQQGVRGPAKRPKTLYGDNEQPVEGIVPRNSSREPS